MKNCFACITKRLPTYISLNFTGKSSRSSALKVPEEGVAVAAAAAVVGVTRALKQDLKVESALAIDVAEGELVHG